jgi:hypothetical protein
MLMQIFFSVTFTFENHKVGADVPNILGYSLSCNVTNRVLLLRIVFKFSDAKFLTIPVISYILSSVIYN